MRSAYSTASGAGVCVQLALVLENPLKTAVGASATKAVLDVARAVGQRRVRTLIGLPPFRIAQAGLGLVPEGRQVFPTLTAEENLIATSAARFGAARWTLDRVYNFFPTLAERRNHMGNELSGGEQQMLAIGRALMTNPKLLILDEATEGLAPKIRAEIWQCLTRLKQEGQAILIVDKHLDALLRIADRHVVIEKGHVVWTGSSDALAADQIVRQRYLQV